MIGLILYISVNNVKKELWAQGFHGYFYTSEESKVKYKNRLLIPSICRKILLLNSQTNNMTLDFLGIINNNSKLKNYSRGSHKTCIDFSTKLINQLDLKEKELYCLLEKNKLTIIEEKENEKVGKI